MVAFCAPDLSWSITNKQVRIQVLSASIDLEFGGSVIYGGRAHWKMWCTVHCLSLFIIWWPEEDLNKSQKFVKVHERSCFIFYLLFIIESQFVCLLLTQDGEDDNKQDIPSAIMGVGHSAAVLPSNLRWQCFRATSTTLVSVSNVQSTKSNHDQAYNRLRCAMNCYIHKEH
jgi:hypothetical protein